MSEELKPCPFCGSSNHIKIIECDWHNWYVGCDAPDCGVDMSRNTEQAAIEAWNRRTDSGEKP